MFDVFYIGKAPGIFPHERVVTSVDHARELSRTRYCWVLNYLSDYTNFDFLWEPVPWEANQIHVWPSQHQDNGGTYLVPKEPTDAVNRNHNPVPRIQSVPIIGVDHGNGLSIECEINTRYINDYLGTLKRILGKVTDEYVWVVTSVCDYTDFDFTWHPSEWQLEMLHVFASDNQKFGDTFYIHVPSFVQKVENLALLEWYETIHFVEDISIPRKPIPVCLHNNDSHVPAVWEYDFQSPVVQFARYNTLKTLPAINLWRQETKAITPIALGSESVLVPREAKNFLKTQLYDYPVIDRSFEDCLDASPLDVIFISNGEHGADHHFQYLCWAVQQHYYVKENRIARVDGVKGRVACYQAAARLSQTDWFLAVFAKLQVNDDFDWRWQPDRLQEPKHYIFHALNPVNNLVYGHQAMIAYNKKLVLENPGQGLDFTLDQPHEVVPIISGTAYYDNDPWTCWRTAFREVIKLKHSLPDIDAEYRLDKWLTVGEGINGHWSTRGAQDAVEFYDAVNGDFSEIKKSYEWEWLASYALMKRGLASGR